ncbi:MAG: hypothetical protein KKE16_00450 [Firmicutes bacterium]|nr:hypothetical protein [Bacillota bacterium]
MKKLALALVLALSVFALSGCALFGPEEETFSGTGMTIVLDDTFLVSDSVVAPLFITSLKHIFMGLRETKSDALSVGIDSLSEYIEAVLDNSGHSSVTVYESESGEYFYAYYSATVDEIEYGYMIVCMEGTSHYYLMNFGCLYKELEDNKEQYISWADTITVE